MQARLDGGRRFAEQFGRFVGPQSFDVAEHQNVSVILGKSVDRSLDLVAHFAPFEGFAVGDSAPGDCRLDRRARRSGTAGADRRSTSRAPASRARFIRAARTRMRCSQVESWASPLNESRLRNAPRNASCTASWASASLPSMRRATDSIPPEFERTTPSTMVGSWARSLPRRMVEDASAAAGGFMAFPFYRIARTGTSGMDEGIVLMRGAALCLNAQNARKMNK